MKGTINAILENVSSQPVAETESVNLSAALSSDSNSVTKSTNQSSVEVSIKNKIDNPIIKNNPLVNSQDSGYQYTDSNGNQVFLDLVNSPLNSSNKSSSDNSKSITDNGTTGTQNTDKPTFFQNLKNWFYKDENGTKKINPVKVLILICAILLPFGILLMLPKKRIKKYGGNSYRF